MHCKKLSNTHYSSVTMNEVNSNHLAEEYSSTSTLIMCGSTISEGGLSQSPHAHAR